MCDWGGGPYGNGSYDPHGITKHFKEPVAPEDKEVSQLEKLEVENKQLRQTILELRDELWDNLGE